MTGLLIRWGIVALVIAGLAGAWQLERAHRRTAEAEKAVVTAQLDEAVKVNADQEKKIGTLTVARDTAFRAIENRDKIVARLANDLNVVRLEAAHVAHDPVCPVDGLMLVYDRLRAKRTPAPPDADRGPARPNPGTVAQVP